MPVTTIESSQVRSQAIQRSDLNTTTVGQAVVAKILQGSNISLSSTGADAGTGDVTISAGGAFTSRTVAYTLLATDSGKYIICSGGSWTLTLPAPAIGLFFQVRNDMGIAGTTGTITISPSGGTIDGAASMALLPQQACTLFSDGTSWRTLGLNREVILGTLDTTVAAASASVLLPAGFRYYDLEFTGVLPATNSDYLIIQFSVNAGSTWITTGYYWGVIYNSSTTATAYSDSSNVGSFNAIPPMSNASAALTGHAKVRLYPGSATQWPTYIWDSGSRTSTGADNKYNGFGVCAQVGPINALKYSMNSGGNITNAFLTVKGVV